MIFETYKEKLFNNAFFNSIHTTRDYLNKEKLPKWLDDKLVKYSVLLGVTKEELLVDAKQNLLSTLVLAKNPIRQNIAENAQFEFLRNIKNIKLEKLPTVGSKAIRLKNGEFIYGAFKLGSTKSLDACDGSTFICLKYIKEAGGAQDNQFIDVASFLREAVEYTNTHTDSITFAAIVDGAYALSKLSLLKQLETTKVKVYTSDTYTSCGGYC